MENASDKLLDSEVVIKHFKELNSLVAELFSTLNEDIDQNIQSTQII